MGLFSDLEESKKLWSSSSIVFKIVIIISVFLTISSFASLSEAIFKWRGFIADAIEFYRIWITLPIKELFLTLNLNISLQSIDFIAMQSIWVTGMIRRNFFLISELKDKIPNPNIYKSLMVILYSFTFIVLIIVLSKYNQIYDSQKMIIGVLFTFFLYFIYPWLIRYNKNEKAIYYFPGAMALLIIFILGAINSGFNQSL